MKILLVNKFLYAKGGDAISTLNTGRLLSKKGHRVFYWGMDHPKNQEFSHRDLFVPFINYDKRAGPVSSLREALNILYSFDARKKIEKLITIEKPDIVHLNNFAHQISPSILDVLTKHNIPTVMTLHDYKLICPRYTMFSNGKLCERCKDGKYFWCFLKKCTKNSYSKSLLNTIEMYLHHRLLHIYDKINVLIATSNFLREKHSEMGFRGKIFYLPNFIFVEDYTPLYEYKEKYIVYFGRLSQEKGLFTLLKAVKGLDIQLKIIGIGPLREALMQKAKKEGLDNVVFKGYMRGEVLKNEIRLSMASTVPSEWYEPFGLTILESFALGKPVIGSRIGGIPELVKDGKTGYLIEPGNADHLRNKIIKLCQDKERIVEMGKNARRFAEENFNSENYYKRLMEIYQMAIEKNASKSSRKIH